MDQDEFLSFYTDSTPTWHDVMHVQVHTPISLDPPAYHLLSHLAMDLFGHGATSLRAPAIFGFLLMQLALFLLVRELSGRRAGLIAMALPVATASFRYAVEGRPYGLLLGMNAVAFLCWFTAAQRFRQQGRIWQMILLSLAIIAAITSHYFGVLVLVPLVFGELARCLTTRRVDRAMVANVVFSGLAGVLMVLPFKEALKPYQQHYYTSTVTPRAISQGYRELFVRYNEWPLNAQRIVACLLVLSVMALTVWALRRFRQRPAEQPSWVWLALLGFAMLPVFGFLFGKYATHTMEVRYVVATVIPFTVVLALLLAEHPLSGCVLVALLLCGAITGVLQVRAAGHERNRVLATMVLPPTVQQRLEHDPNEGLYTQSLNQFFLVGYYAPEAVIRSRITLIFDENREVALTGHNTNAVTAEYLTHFTALHTTAFATMECARGGILLDTHSSWEWIDKALATEQGFSLVPEGFGLGGDLYRIVPCPGSGKPQGRITRPGASAPSPSDR